MGDKYKSLHHEHDPESIQRRLHKHRLSPLKDFVYGAIDGTVTTFAIVSGVVGAGFENRTILILGFANLLADGFSMAASNYSGTKAEIEERELITSFEKDEINRHPEGEIEELRQIFINKGIEGSVLDTIVRKIASNKKEWIKIMLAEEYGLGETLQVPWKTALVTFLAFFAFGSIPLISYLLKLREDFFVSVILTGMAFYGIGALKSKWTKKSPWLSGLETLSVGAIAALIAYSVGNFLS